MSDPTRYTLDGLCAVTASGQTAAALLRSMINSRRLMASPAPRTKSGIKRLSHFWIENCAVRRTRAGPQPCPLWVKSRHRGISNQCPLYPQKRTLEPARVLPSTQQLRQLGNIAAIRRALVRRLVGAVRLNGLTACAATISPRRRERSGAASRLPISSITPLLQRRMTRTARPGSRTQ